MIDIEALLIIVGKNIVEHSKLQNIPTINILQLVTHCNSLYLSTIPAAITPVSRCSQSLGYCLTGVPDPPLSVQIESGPNHGSVMVNWLPVTITATGTSNGARVAGYTIYVDGTRVKELQNPTGNLSYIALSVLTDPLFIVPYPLP